MDGHVCQVEVQSFPCLSSPRHPFFVYSFENKVCKLPTSGVVADILSRDEGVTQQTSEVVEGADTRRYKDGAIRFDLVSGYSPLLRFVMFVPRFDECILDSSSYDRPPRQSSRSRIKQVINREHEERSSRNRLVRSPLEGPFLQLDHHTRVQVFASSSCSFETSLPVESFLLSGELLVASFDRIRLSRDQLQVRVRGRFRLDRRRLADRDEQPVLFRLLECRLLAAFTACTHIHNSRVVTRRTPGTREAFVLFPKP